MPLILAIEPDRQQANELAAIVRGRLRAELILADTAEPALVALGDRVPDLILTSALLSTKDEAVLAERLRMLDAAAAERPVRASRRSRVVARDAGWMRPGGVRRAVRRVPRTRRRRTHRAAFRHAGCDAPGACACHGAHAAPRTG